MAKEREEEGKSTFLYITPYSACPANKHCGIRELGAEMQPFLTDSEFGEAREREQVLVSPFGTLVVS
jgi:hypothetical protein